MKKRGKSSFLNIKDQKNIQSNTMLLINLFVFEKT